MMKNMDSQFEVKPPPGSSPRPEDTPRTKNLKELRLRRLQYFEKRTNSNDSPTTVELSNQDENHSNQRDVNQNGPAEVNIRSSMIRDSRVTVPGPDSTRLQSQRPRNFSTEPSIPDAKRLYRTNNPPSDTCKEMNNNNVLGQGRPLVEGHVLGMRSSPPAGAHQIVSNNHSHQDSQPSRITLPTLSPRDTSIINQGELSLVSPKNNKDKTVSKKGKSVKGKKFKNSQSFGRDSFEKAKGQKSMNNSIGVNGRSVTKHEEVNKRGARKSVIEAEFEDDYSELGLSMDRVGYERVTGHFPPAFSPSRKVKSRDSEPTASSIKASKSAENFNDLRLNAYGEELHQRTNVSDSNEFFVKRSKTYEGLSNVASGNFVKDSISESQDQLIRKSDHALNRVDLFQDNDGSSVATSIQQENRALKTREPSSAEFIRHDNVNKETPNRKPVVTESSEFTKTHSKLTGDDMGGNDLKQSVIREEFQSNTLESILGKDRMERLFKNLAESAWIEEERGTVVGSSYTNSKDMALESYRSEQEGRASYNVPLVEKNCDISELGLTTHRPADQQQQSTKSPPVKEIKQSAGSVISTTRKGAKCSFSSEQIYERARKLSTNSTEDNLYGSIKSQKSADKFSTSKDGQMGQKVHENEDSNKFDFMRGIPGIKKEFYKTVTVTDSTAVSETSMNTAKQSRQSVESPRGQIPNPNVTSAHRRSLSISGAWPTSCSKEEHIEGIRQHVADIRTQQFEDKIRAGMPYTTSSIERYFASMEHLNLETTNDFEPVPEPNIIETPRDQASSNLATMPASSGKKNNVSKIRKPESQIEINGVSVQSSQSEKPSRGSSSKDGLNATGEKNKVLSKEEIGDGGGTHLEKWKDFKLDNDNMKRLNEMFEGDASDDDDLFTKVTSMVDNMDGVMSSRVKSLGIDFDFLKKKTENQIKASTKDDLDVASVIISEDSDSDLDETDSKPVDQKIVSNTNSSNVLKARELKSKEAQDEVEILFRMSPRNADTKERIPSSSEHVPEKSGEPSMSNTLKLNLNNTVTEKSLDQSSAGVSQVKVCPECAEVNKIYVTWCVECGAVLSGVDPVPCKPRRETSRHLGVSTSSILSKSATNFKNRLEESMNNPPASSGSGWLQHNKGAFQQSQNKTGVNTKEVLQLRRDEAVRESDEFVYEKIESPVRALPKALQSELSLDLNAKPEAAGKKVRRGEDELATLSEGINFEYSEHVSPKKALPAALQEELNLNLSLDGSHTTASFQAGFNKAVRRSEDSVNQVRESIDEDDVTVRAGPSGSLQLGDQANMADEDSDVDSVDTLEGENYEDDDDVPIHLDETEEGSEKIVYKQFIKNLMNDPRFKTTQEGRPKSAVQPLRSEGRPKSAVGQRVRPQSASVMSKVRASIEKEGYQRKWNRSSTTAWSTKSHGEIRARSSIHASQEGDVPPSRVGSSANRPISAVRKSTVNTTNSMGAGGDMKPKKANNRPTSAVFRDRRRGQVLSKSLALKTVDLGDTNQQPDVPASRSAVFTAGPGSTKRPPARNLINTYAKYFEMSPRIASGEFSQWLCLPDEIWLHIMGYLSQGDLARCAQACMQLHRIALDESLWRSIVVKKKHQFTDEWLIEIGRRQPASLSLVQCHGENVTANGVRELFRQCFDSLKELSFTGCSRGELTGDSILLHAASRCRSISHLDASWSNVNDNGVLALIEASQSLESVCLNGCQVITDEAIHSMVAKHGETLKTLELFGCFNVTPRSALSISNYCKSLTILNLGQCWKLTDVSIARLASSLTDITNLDLRGVKQMKDQTVHQLMHHCKRLRSLSLANCPNLTDVSLTGIATFCSHIQSLDLCGCKGISDMGVRALAMACRSMDYLDISSTAITHKSVSSLASYCHTNLEVLKLNFCKHITVPSLVRLAKNCKKIRKVYLYGVNGLRHMEEVRRVNSNLWIEM